MVNIKNYEAALEGAAFYFHETAGCLEIRGRDQEAFIQRQTTNDVRLLGAERCLTTVLTSPTARIVDVLLLFERDAGAENPAWLAFTLPGMSEQTFLFLKKRIFFMDQVELANRSAEFAQFELLGPECGRVLSALGLAQPPAAGGTAHVELGGSEGLVLNPVPAVGLGYRLVGRGETDAVRELLLHAGAVELDAETYDCLRIEAGVPASGAELSEDYTPLEVGLGEAVSATKGCYTGQEVIARQLSYDKVTQSLRKLRLSAETRPGSTLEVDGRPAGRVTSAAISPRFGAIGLGVVKRGVDVGVLTFNVDG